jgi:CRISPR-associated protein Csb3
VGFPIVELMGAIGLNHARPLRPDRRNKLKYYIYGVVGRAERDSTTWLPPSLLRVALGASTLPFPSRRFHLSLGWPGKEGQAQSITMVTEETTT